MMLGAIVLDHLAAECHRIAKEHGFWEGKTPVSRGPECIALMHSELSEALEVMRLPEPPAELIAEELADAIIRILDYCGAAGLPIGKAVEEKVAKNELRALKHEKAF